VTTNGKTDHDGGDSTGVRQMAAFTIKQDGYNVIKAVDGSGEKVLG
jgi:hypothetical protein